MFNIDDNFLASIGYDVALLTPEQRAQYQAEILEEVNTRLSERLALELTEEQVVDMESIQNSAERAEQWLYEFHSDFAGIDDYKVLVDAMGESEAKVFYATALWMQDAVPDYGVLAQGILNEYQAELIEKYKLVEQAMGGAA